MDTVEEFFAEVKNRGHEPFLRRISGTVRFDLTNGSRNGTNGANGADQWTVAISNGDLSVAKRGGRADSVVRTDRKLFEQIITGQANAMASMLRGLVYFEGDPELVALSGRLFASAGMRRPRRV
jgi:putative sterol carrier protein